MKKKTMDGNGAVAHVAYALSELFAIYPITPSTPMAELCDKWASEGKQNAFFNVPKVVEMQSEAGASGVLHGALTAGALATTFTSSQGLLLMIPEMYKLAGELLPAVFHVSARSISTHALCIFGDHQDVMACRQTGFAMLCASTVQEAHDFALISHLCALQSSVPFLHFFDGFRTSHETANIEVLEYDEIRKLVDEGALAHFRNRALTPDKPVCRGTAQNFDVYFQNREACNPYYTALPDTVKGVMEKVSAVTGRKYAPFEFVGDTQAEFVVVMMGSAVGAVEETVLHLNTQGKKTGLIKVRLYRPFSATDFLQTLPKTCKKIAVLDRTKEAGALGEPLFLDVCATLKTDDTRRDVAVIGGRYGLGSKEFNPTCALAVFKNLESENPKHPFTVGITDDVSFQSLDVSEKLCFSRSDEVACKFYGLGSDGTVGANKNSIKIIGDNTDLFVQAYFCYDSRKSGGTTVSHLRFSKSPLRSSYLVENADFIACHNPSYLTRLDMLSGLKTGGTFLLNCPWKADELSARLPSAVKRALAEREANFYVADATKLADEVGLKGRTSVVMQALFFLLNETIMPYEKAVSLLKKQLSATFESKGEAVVNANLLAVDKAKERLTKIDVPSAWQHEKTDSETQQTDGDEYYRNFIQPVLCLEGDRLPVSAFNADGSVPTGTTKLEKHGAPYLLPKWIEENCIQCNQCSFVCPHACIRPFLFSDEKDGFHGKPALGLEGYSFRIQVSPLDCMGCGLCADVCPTKEKALVMTENQEIVEQETENWKIAEGLPRVDVSQKFKRDGVKGSQFFPPLFEFSYACAGCGETSYIKVLTQLFGENMVIANATGCSSIYGASAPTCPYTKNEKGQGPAWASSLFEDNAEFGLGMRLAYDFKGEDRRSVWMIGGDGWAYDIGFGGLDHVLSLGERIRILVLDSEVYSNTGGQASKATPMGAAARFAYNGKRRQKKNLALMAMCYGDVYVAQVSLGADKAQFLRALTEAENYAGTALIIAYSPCIAHGVAMQNCLREEERAVKSGHFPLFRYNPDLKKEGKNPFVLDSKAPGGSFSEFYDGEGRFSSAKKTRPTEADALKKNAEKLVNERYALYEKIARGEFMPN